MEEKERYELFGEHCIKDNNPNARCQLLNTYQVCVILNEQDKEIEQLKKFDDLNKTFFELFRTAFKGPDKVDDLFNTLQTIQEKQDQDKISFALEQLELARRRIDRLGYNENKCLNKKDCIEDCLEEIDNQIKELKGE